ncbi:hypothetical protein BIFANG_02482 [Bifidobacterium angulatum DSM 20098 = JCM 7096]|uniref:Uncharacterized protein n=1 Tax=Bifidobacterium angulatum DSM 20098 = JCM 7096 TaxID=518635 RepID=C4FDU4_9BIFI|nr:hypothetical protein BIFANG_02482 [Bifidobacterium angulatum DSM 20098 = JCM 7096]
MAWPAYAVTLRMDLHKAECAAFRRMPAFVQSGEFCETGA